jgi:hypothetical protein
MYRTGALVVALWAGCGGGKSAGDGGVDGGSDGGAARMLGTVSSVVSGAACLSGAPMRAACTMMTVSCPGVEDIAVNLAVTEPYNGSAHGTVFTHAGGGGNFYEGSNVQGYLQNGLRTAQVAWATPWEATASSGILAAACRPATVLQWIFDNVHGHSRSGVPSSPTRRWRCRT